MEEIKIEEIKENPGEETPEEKTPEEEEPQETPQEEKETPEKPESPKEEYTDREKRYYARMKKAEEEAKKAKEMAKKPSVPVSDVDAILEVQQATKGLGPEEVAELKLRATAKGSSLSEARKDENFALWQKAYQEKVVKEKQVPGPSSPSLSGGAKSYKEVTEMSDEDRKKHIQEQLKVRREKQGRGL